MVDVGGEMNWKETTFGATSDRPLILMKAEDPVLC